MHLGLLRINLALALVALCLSPRVWAEDSRQVFTGTLGKAAIVVELDARYNEGRYFYRKYRTDLALETSKEGDALVMLEGAAMDGDSRPTLRLLPTLSGWSGEWKAPSGKTLKVDLQPARLPDVPADAAPYLAQLHDTQPYEYLRLQGLLLKKGKTETFMGYTLQWWSEPKSGASLFEVVSGYAPAAQERINQYLRARLWSEVSQHYGCSGSYAQSAQPLWMSSSVMSVRVSTEYYCGGAYPDQNNESLNFDTRTGQLLSLEDVLWVGQGEPLHREESPDAFSEESFNYRAKELAPWLVEQLSKRYPTEMTVVAEGENDCGYDEPEPWQFPMWQFGEKGVTFFPSYPHVMAVCGYVEWGVLPYGLLKQHPGAVKLQLPES